VVSAVTSIRIGEHMEVDFDFLAPFFPALPLKPRPLSAELD
jgi:hypothetical protein